MKSKTYRVRVHAIADFMYLLTAPNADTARMTAQELAYDDVLPNKIETRSVRCTECEEERQVNDPCPEESTSPAPSSKAPVPSVKGISSPPEETPSIAAPDAARKRTGPSHKK